MFDLTGKTAIITGSSKGIGKSIAMQMALQGAKVVVSSRKADVCEETAAEMADTWNSTHWSSEEEIHVLIESMTSPPSN